MFINIQEYPHLEMHEAMHYTANAEIDDDEFKRYVKFQEQAEVWQKRLKEILRVNY